jgi:predicted homoserine dehydrogenase-like protein
MIRTSNKKKIGIVGTGFIARGFIETLLFQPDVEISKVVTRRKINDLSNFPQKEKLTNSIGELVDNSDIIVELSGDIFHAAAVINEALRGGLPVVTMNSEFHITVGSYFKNKGLITEAVGDQPGCLAALKENIEEMGFNALVYGNIKKFLNINPSLEEMIFWSEKQGISLNQVVSFTDGTKLQIEAAFIANGLNASIIQNGLVGPECENIEPVAFPMAEFAKVNNTSVSDFILSNKQPKGVFIIAEDRLGQAKKLKYYGMGEGPFYVFLRNYHLCHFEIIKTVRRIFESGKILLDNGDSPQISVAAVAKCGIKKNSRIKKGIGSFLCRGVAVRKTEFPEHVPIGLLSDALVLRDIEAGEIINFDSVELKESFALNAWSEINKNPVKIV